MSFIEELKRRNVVRVGLAYAVIAWLLAQVAEFAFGTFGAPDWVLKTFVVVLVLGMPLALIFAWAFEVTPEGIRLGKNVDRKEPTAARTGLKANYVTLAGIAMAAAIAVGLQWMNSTEAPVAVEASDSPPIATALQQQAPDKSIAVLPFVAMTASQDDEFFADGLSEEILNVLAKIDGLKVVGRTSSFYYKGRSENLRAIAEALGVAHILEGSVRRSGNQIRVTAQLIKAVDGFHLWSETYDRSDGDTFAIQDEISSNVSRALQAEILGDTRTSGAAGGKNVEAQNLYLIAQAAMARRSRADVRRARDLYRQAAEIDAENPAYLAGYAHAVAIQYWNARDIPAEQAISEAEGAIEKALALGQPSADVLAIAGLVEELRALAVNEAQAKSRALEYYQQALEQDPNDILALQWLASLYLDINEAQLARDNFERVVELDPLNTLALTGLANAYFGLGLHDEARRHLFKVQSLFPEAGITYRYLSNIEFQAGRIDKASFWVDLASHYDPTPFEIYSSLINYIAFGWANETMEAAERFKETSNGIDISRLAQARLDLDLAVLSAEAQSVFQQTGDEGFAALSAWADAIAGDCASAVTTLEHQYPSLKGEVIEYIDGPDLINAVLLAHCNAAAGNAAESRRLTSALLASDHFSSKAIQANPGRRIVKVATLAVSGDVAGAISELQAIDLDNSMILFSPIALPIDQLPVFEALYEQEPFRKYANRERYRIADQARMRASGETKEEIRAELLAAGYTLRD